MRAQSAWAVAWNEMGHELAQRLGLTLFGRAMNKHFLCYSGFERFDAQPELAEAVPAISR